MKRPLQITLLALSGLGVLHASLFSDLYLRYVKEGMRPLLIGSGLLLLGLAVAEAWWGRKDAEQPEEAEGGKGGRAGNGHERHAGFEDGHERHAGFEDGHERHAGFEDGHERHAGFEDGHERHAGFEDGHERHAGFEDGHERHAGHGHDHSHTPKVAWLLFLPALSLLLYAPPALGAFTASRETPKAVAEEDHFDPLPATSPLPITLTDFTQRVQQDRERAIEGRTVQMTGFVTPAGDGDGWYLTRLMLSCCAADAQSVKVRIHGVQAPPADTWVTLTGTWHPSGTLGTKSAAAALDAHTLKKIPKPTNGYTDALPLTPP
ncbi:TIGR03943 family protein [Streptomyces chromofuscus]|uniref:TIGR03943 family protein n=1 Tax=Streptomyces chromofuscus TaxID=42881 RepID=A0A7M2T3L9_STRCW|nr:TIGR03943 family protein [Streptomyces chromofuscus]QOV42278.1 TIGR03943 family protein [Streptomyces chromofuscus]